MLLDHKGSFRLEDRSQTNNIKNNQLEHTYKYKYIKYKYTQKSPFTNTEWHNICITKLLTQLYNKGVIFHF